jgi:hypothetical protein
MAKTNSEEELSRLHEEGKISDAEYEQLHAALQRPPAPESRASTDSRPCPLTREVYAFRKRVLLTGFVICLIGLPIGLVLNLPLVWGLSILGLVITPIKWHLTNKKLHSSS